MSGRPEMTAGLAIPLGRSSLHIGAYLSRAGAKCELWHFAGTGGARLQAGPRVDSSPEPSHHVTTIVPCIFGCSEQKYVYVPGLPSVTLYR